MSWWSKTILYDVRHDCDEWKGDSSSSMCLDIQLHSSTSKVKYGVDTIIIEFLLLMVEIFYLNIHLVIDIHVGIQMLGVRKIFLVHIHQLYAEISIVHIYTCRCVCTIGNVHFSNIFVVYILLMYAWKHLFI